MINTIAQPDVDLEQFKENGFVVVPVFSPDEVAQIRQAFMAAAKDGPVAGLSEVTAHFAANYTPDDPLYHYPRMLHPHLHPELPIGTIAMNTMIDPRLGGILARLFREEPYAVQSMFYFKPPGSRGQDLHQDNFYLKVKPGTCIAAWIAIDDADEENGGMVCVPGTANMDIVCPQRADPTESFTVHHVEPPPGTRPQLVKMRAGDVLFFNGSVIHGSYPNTSKSRFRRALICHYVAASTLEVSDFYKAFSFDGTRREIAVNHDGGPCGSDVPAPNAPH